MNQRHIALQIDPMHIPPIADRVNIVHEYARRYVNHAKEHYSLRDYVEQVMLEMKDRTVATELKQEIRRLERICRGGY